MSLRSALLGLALVLLGALPALAQTSPGFNVGQTLSSAALNAAFVAKQDYGGSGANLTDLNASHVTSGTLGSGFGGTGLSSLTAHCVIIGAGTSAVHLVCPTASGDVLTDNGASADPSFQAPAIGLSGSNTWTALQTLSGGAVITPETTIATNEAGYLGSPVNTQNTDYTLVMSDAGKTIYHTSATAHTYTIPANASVAFPIGTVIVLSNESGGGALTIAITTDTLEWTSSTGSRTLAANGTAAIEKMTATLWRMTGDGIS